MKDPFRKQGKGKGEEGYGDGRAAIEFGDDVLLDEEEMVEKLLACLTAPDYRPPLPSVAIEPSGSDTDRRRPPGRLSPSILRARLGQNGQIRSTGTPGSSRVVVKWANPFWGAFPERCIQVPCQCNKNHAGLNPTL